MIRHLLWILLSIILLSGCSQKKDRSNNIDKATKIIVDEIPNNNDLENIFEEHSFIILNDTSSEAMFKNINKCIVSGDRIFILDYFGNSSVKAFDISGNFLFNVGKRGSGPNTYYKVTDFDVVNNEIYLLDSKSRKILHYNRNGIFKDEYSYLDKLEGINSFFVTSDGYFMLSMDKNITDDSEILKADKEFNIKNEILKFKADATINHLVIGNFRRCGNQIAYTHPISDEIYIFNEKGSIEQIHQVSFTKEEIPSEIRSNYTEVSKARKQGRKLSYFYETPFIAGKKLFSTVYYKSNKAFFAMDLEKPSYMINEYNPPKNLSLYVPHFPIYADEEKVISVFDGMFYDILDNQSKNKINDDMKAHIDEGGKILTIHKLKK